MNKINIDTIQMIVGPFLIPVTHSNVNRFIYTYNISPKKIAISL